MRISQGFNSLHIIESLGEVEGNPGQKLADRLKPELTDERGILVHYHQVFCIDALEELLEKIYRQDGGNVPALHLNATDWILEGAF